MDAKKRLCGVPSVQGQAADVERWFSNREQYIRSRSENVKSHKPPIWWN